MSADARNVLQWRSRKLYGEKMFHCFIVSQFYTKRSVSDETELETMARGSKCFHVKVLPVQTWVFPRFEVEKPVNTFHLSPVVCFLQLTVSFPAQLNFLFEVYLALSNEAKNKINLVLMHLMTSLKRKWKVILLSGATKQHQQYREHRFMCKLLFSVASEALGCLLALGNSSVFTFVTAFMWLLSKMCIYFRALKSVWEHSSTSVKGSNVLCDKKIICTIWISSLSLLCKSTSNRMRT